MLFVGVDGGGSKTAALLADAAGQVLGWGISGASNYHLVGIDSAFASVRAAMDSALQGRTPDAVCFSMAGADMPHDFTRLQSKLSELDLHCPFTVRNDVIGILRAGSRFSYGVAIVCGSGFNAGGISKASEEWRLPALGAITGDYAGARHLTTRALGMAFRSWDGRGQPTNLQEAILRALDAPDFETLAERWVQGQLTSEQVYNLAPLVFEVSDAGDAVAQELIRDQGIEFGAAANAILHKLNLVDEDCDVVLGGSLIYGKGDLLMNTVREVIASTAVRPVVKRLSVPPVVGAVLLAAESIGVAVDKAFTGTLNATLPPELQVPASR
jgi:N-acetylglucosamine kinase-like BadF-type ATPase